MSYKIMKVLENMPTLAITFQNKKENIETIC